ncbi:hypothetical protein JD969_08860 [Planctomycetota bacterium]|nr:hypothetical protein JD969_08860 [Planctomycetota bacterium]
MHLLKNVAYVAALTVVSCLGISDVNAAFAPGYPGIELELPTVGQPINAVGSIGFVAGGQILYTGNDPVTSKVNSFRVTGNYLDQATIDALFTQEFSAVKAYISSGGINMVAGTSYQFVDLNLSLDPSLDDFVFHFEFTDLGNQTKLAAIDDTAVQIVSFQGMDYQLRLVSFEYANGGVVDGLSILTNPLDTNTAMTADVKFEFVAVPTPATASISLGLIGLGVLKRRRQA